jgi:hypothetical protein
VEPEILKTEDLTKGFQPFGKNKRCLRDRGAHLVKPSFSGADDPVKFAFPMPNFTPEELKFLKPKFATIPKRWR